VWGHRGATVDRRSRFNCRNPSGVAFHAFRKVCGSLLFAHGKTLKQVQGWLRHSNLTTTMNVYIDQVDDGLGSADVWDDILGAGGPTVAPRALIRCLSN
jgi:integrase